MLEDIWECWYILWNSHCLVFLHVFFIERLLTPIITYSLHYTCKKTDITSHSLPSRFPVWHDFREKNKNRNFSFCRSGEDFKNMRSIRTDFLPFPLVWSTRRFYPSIFKLDSLCNAKFVYEKKTKNTGWHTLFYDICSHRYSFVIGWFLKNHLVFLLVWRWVWSWD